MYRIGLIRTRPSLSPAKFSSLRTIRVKTLKNLMTALEIKGRSKLKLNDDREKLIKNFLDKSTPHAIKDLLVKNKNCLNLVLHIKLIDLLDAASDDWIEEFEDICIENDNEENEDVKEIRRDNFRRGNLYNVFDQIPDMGEGKYLEDGVYVMPDGTTYDSK